MWVGSPEPESGKIRESGLAGGGVRSWYQYPGRTIQSVWLPKDLSHPPAQLVVRYSDAQLGRVVDGVVASVHRCSDRDPRGPDPGDPTQDKPTEVNLDKPTEVNLEE